MASDMLAMVSSHYHNRLLAKIKFLLINDDRRANYGAYPCNVRKIALNVPVSNKCREYRAFALHKMITTPVSRS